MMMRQGYVIVGAILAIIGLLILVQSIPTKTVLFNETFTVSALSHKAYSWTFWGSPNLQISFSVSGGSIDFRVMDEVEYWKMRAGETYQYYTVPNRYDVSSVDFGWTPPDNVKVYFVWDNGDSWFTSRSVSAYFYYMTQTTQVSPGGILLLLGGLAVVGYGITYKQPSTATQQPSALTRSQSENNLT